MERLTKPATRHTSNKYVSAIGSGYGVWPRIIQRLAAYENTGLEPEEIKPRWIPVTERLPEADMGKVLCSTVGGHYKILEWSYTFNCWSDPCGMDFKNFQLEYVTHWMPLPEPPKEV